MSSLIIAALSCAVVSSPGVCAQTPEVAAQVRACAGNDAVACDRLAATLETLFAGANDAERPLARKLARAAVRVVRKSDATASRVIAKTARACAANEIDACHAIARTLVGIFSGADAELDASADRLLARSFASYLSSFAATLVQR